MKKTVFTLFIAIFALTFANSCKKDVPADEEIMSKIVGAWEGEYDAGEGVSLDRSNHTGRAKQTINFTDSSTYSIKRDGKKYVTNGIYAIKNASIHFSHNQKYREIIKITDSKMTLENSDTGDKFRYKKD